MSEAGILSEAYLSDRLHEAPHSVSLLSRDSEIWSFSVKISLCFLQQICQLQTQDLRCILYKTLPNRLKIVDS